MDFILTLFCYIFLFVYCCLNEKQINKQNVYYKRKIKYLTNKIKRLENYERNDSFFIENINNRLERIEVGKHEKYK